MKKICALVLGCFIFLLPFYAESREGGEGPSSVPRVIYMSPANQSVVDISDGKPVKFEWAMLPIPSGNRDSYRFVLYKGPNYGFVTSKTIDDRTFSTEVLADKFEPGAEYWWYVKQRDARTMIWSQYDIWYLKIIKK